MVRTVKEKKPETIHVEATLDMTGWKYRWNDQEVDEETYNRLTKEHMEWVKEEEKKQAALLAAKQVEDKPKRKKK